MSDAKPFRSRKSSATPPPSSRPINPSSSASSRPPSRLSVSPATSSAPNPSPSDLERPENPKHKENVTVTVRFRPLSHREINKGDEIAWYADGDCTVRNEFNPSIAFAFDRVFGPATTTRHVYDVAAQHVVRGAMHGINGTVFAYGVTSSGKTHTMHGEQKSPGVIPLAVKDVFNIIQETPEREFLLRVSYLEIYNEVINDLLDSTGQNLRIREDTQGTYVDGIKEEVVLSPAHALSLIATGEAHRHVGSNNFNLLSSRSHTIFTLTIESSPRGGMHTEEDVTLSMLNLIDLAGSESSKTETTGLRRKEGSYINKSLLTLGTVIFKLTDGKATHVPYRDSKLTRLLQSSLSGHGRISLICTITPASSNSEETHNTLKFAHRSKHVEIKASQNKIMDEKSLIKKYQKEISCLKQELEQLKRGMMGSSIGTVSTDEDLVNWKLQLEAGQVKLQSRLEEEEQAKAALLGRIQRLKKLILVSTKNSMLSSIPERSGYRRRHSFGEDELAYLPDKRREHIIDDDDDGSCATELSVEGRDGVTNLDELVKDIRRNRRHGMLGWFKLRKPESPAALSPNTDSTSSPSESPASCSKSSKDHSSNGRQKSTSRRGGESTTADSLPEITQAGDLFSVTVGSLDVPSSGTTIMDQMDLLQEQMKMLAGEVALSISSLKRLSEKAASSPEDSQLREQMQKLKDEIGEKRHQIRVLERRMIGSVEMSPHTSSSVEMSQALSKVTTQLNEKMFELEIQSADNRVLQEQLQMKISENAEMQETILLLRQQLDSLLDESSSSSRQKLVKVDFMNNNDKKDPIGSTEEAFVDENTPKSVISLNRIFSQEGSKAFDDHDTSDSQMLIQASEIENLKQDNVKLTEEKEGLEINSKKLAEEASYAKELAAAAAVELKILAEEVTRLSYENVRLTGELSVDKEGCGSEWCHRLASADYRQNASNGTWTEGRTRKQQDALLVEELQKELQLANQQKAALEMALSEQNQIEIQLRKRNDELKRHQEELENELANMWVLVTKLRSGNGSEEPSSKDSNLANIPSRENTIYQDLQVRYQEENTKCRELEELLSMMKGENVSSLDLKALEELQNFHVEAITKICHAKLTNHIL